MGPMNTPIDLKRVITRIPFKIEPKPGGGFIARATDPTVAPLEAATREELHQKILAALSAELPELKLSPNGKHLDISVQVSTPNGGFSISNNPDADGNTPNPNAQGSALEKLLGFSVLHLTPELTKQLAAKAGTGSFRVLINQNEWVRLNSAPNGLTSRAPTNSALSNAASDIPKLDAGAGVIDGQPITPEPSNLSRVLKIIIWVMIIATFAYLYFLNRH